jgi:phosphomannomutase
MYKFIFDVDGTLTPSRAKIDEDFKQFFIDFCLANSVTLVTGSDLPKTKEQLGEQILLSVHTIYCCSGNDVWSKGINIRSNSWKIPDEVKKWLTTELENSKFVLRTGKHLEERIGSLNFSVVGRNATLKERQIYKQWDEINKEREDLVSRFNINFSSLCAKIGGETGIDIYPIGYDKSQIVKDFSTSDKLMFFGDRMDKLGNDYPLKKCIEDNNLGSCFEVKDWQHTKKILAVMKVMT